MKPKVFFIGIGGIGTSALARWFLANGYNVAGSDASPSETTKELAGQGVKVFIGQKAANLDKSTDLVIHSAAIPSENPEFKHAKDLGIPLMPYAKALGGLTNQYKTIAVAGAHGKSTTTSMMSLAAVKAKLDPTVIVGTKLKEFGGNNFRKGKSEYLIIEADEYTNAFSNYSPYAAIILNIDREHLDFYKNLNEIKNAFLGFINNVQSGGILVLNKSDKNLFSLKSKIEKIAKAKKIKVHWYSANKKLEKVLQVFGGHNVLNASAVYDLAKLMGLKEKDVLAALKSFRGAWRRMEYRGVLKATSYKLKANIYDDYAHHPTEIKATLSGIAQKWPKMPLICVFQPHQTKRLEALFNEFTGAFDDANALVLLDIFKVAGREKQVKVSQNIAEKLAKKIESRVSKIENCKLKIVKYLPHSEQKNLEKVLENLLKNISVNPRSNQRKSAIVVMMGAGDIYKLTDLLLSSDNKRANRKSQGANR